MRIGNRTAKERAVARRRAFIFIVSGLCILISSVFLMNLEAPRSSIQTTPADVSSDTISRSPINLAAKSTGPTSISKVTAAPTGASTITVADVDALRLKNLLIPVAGVTSNGLRDSFYDSRSEGRTHGALDIMAPHYTAVLATDDGAILKLHQSGRGGIMLYQSDASGSYVYYYGHLDRFAEGISEGKNVKRGEVIAYVGDTGNAGPGNYHLHFGISKMTAAGKWYGGDPINPYPLLRRDQSTPIIGSK
ncbi:MAG: M23 family metallopeptidase [Blastocatellia bacterium]